MTFFDPVHPTRCGALRSAPGPPGALRRAPQRGRLPTLGGVLSRMRDERGRPNGRVKLLALVLALLLAGPLTVLVVRALVGLVGALY